MRSLVATRLGTGPGTSSFFVSLLAATVMSTFPAATATSLSGTISAETLLRVLHLTAGTFPVFTTTLSVLFMGTGAFPALMTSTASRLMPSTRLLLCGSREMELLLLQCLHLQLHQLMHLLVQRGFTFTMSSLFLLRSFGHRHQFRKVRVFLNGHTLPGRAFKHMLVDD